MITVAFVSPWATTSSTQGKPTKYAGQRGRIGRGRDHVEIAERLAAAARAPGVRDVDRGGMRAERLDDLAHDGQPLPEQAAPGLVAALALGERLQDLRLRRGTHARERPQLLALGRGLQLGERRDAELAPDPRRRLRAEARAAA